MTLNNIFNKVRISKLALLLVCFIAQSAIALADNKLYVADVTVPDNNDPIEVAVCLDNDVSGITSVAMNIQLPTGLNFVTTKLMGKSIIDAKAVGRAAGATIVGNPADGKISLVSLSGIAAGSGPIFTFKVNKIPALGSLSIIKLLNAEVKTSTATYSVANNNLTVVNGSVSKPSDMSLSFGEAAIAMEPGGTQGVAVTLNKSPLKAISGFQADLVLPEGWTATIANGIITNTGSNNRILSTTAFSDETGPLFTINLTAPADFSEGPVTVKLEKIYVTAGFVEEVLNPVELTINPTDAKADVEAAQAKLADLKTAAEALAISEKAKAYESETVQAAVATAEQAITTANTAVAALEAKIAEGKISTVNKEAVAAAIATAEQAVADAKAAVAAAEKAYADQKALDDAAEAGAKASAEASVTALKVALEEVTISEEAKAYEAENVQAAVAAAEKAIVDANAAIKAIEDLIAEGKLATENKEAVAKTILAAQKAVDAAADAAATADAVYAEQKVADETAAAEAAAKTAADTQLAALKTAAEALVISADAKAYEAENVKTAVATAEQAIADANTAIAAVEAKIAEGKLSTDNKEALVTAIADAEQAITDAQTAIATAEQTYIDQLAIDDAAAALAVAKTALQDAITAAKAANVEGMTAESVQALNDAIAAAEAALAAETATVESLNAAKTDVEAAVTGLVVAPLFADGKYYIYNNGAQKYLAAGAAWGTHAVVNATGLDYTLTLADGKYTMDSQVSNGGNNHFLNGEWNDGGAMGWTFEAVEGKEGVYTISNGTQFLTAQENGEVLLKEDATVEAAQWTLKTVEARVAELAAATAEAPVDASFLITDANFGRNDLRKSAWTTEASNLNMSGGNNTNNCAESYHSVFSLSQTLTNLPKGVYALTAQGFYRQDGQDNDNLPVFFANNEAITFPAKTGSENNMSQASESFTAGNYTIAPIYVQVAEDGQLTVGAKLEENTALWCIWDNFQLTYYGADADIEQLKNAAIIAELAALREQLAEKKDQVEVEVVKTEAENALTATADVTGTDAINAAVETLKAALDKVEASLDAKAKLANMKELVDATNVYTAEAKNEYYDQWVVKYNDGTITKAEANALQDPFIVTGWHANITVDNFLLSAWDTNPDFQNAPYYINSWSIEGESDGSNFKVPFFEYWTNDDSSLGEKTLTATMNGLEAGEYNVTAWVRVRMKNGAEAPATGVKLQANDGEAVDVCDGEAFGPMYVKEVAATGTVAEDGVLKIKFNVAADNNVSWLSFKNVKFEKHITVDPIIEAAKTALQDAITAAKAIETEGKNGGDVLAAAITTAETALNAADATAESLTAAKETLLQAKSVFNRANLEEGLVEIAQSQGKDIQDGASRATLVEGEGYNTYTTDGGVCVIFKMYDVNVKDCDYVLVKFAEPVPAGIKIAFWSQSGTANVDVPAGATEYKYVFAEDAGCAIANDILPQITLLTLWNSQTVKVEGVYKHQIPVVDAINSIAADRQNGIIFNMNGQKVDKAQKGLFIINGKKVVIK